MSPLDLSSFSCSLFLVAMVSNLLAAASNLIANDIIHYLRYLAESGIENDATLAMAD